MPVEIQYKVVRYVAAAIAVLLGLKYAPLLQTQEEGAVVTRPVSAPSADAPAVLAQREHRIAGAAVGVEQLFPAPDVDCTDGAAVSDASSGCDRE